MPENEQMVEEPVPEGMEAADPELEEIKDEVLSEVEVALTDEKYFDKFLARLAKSQEPLVLIGREAAQAVKTFDDAAGDTIPEEAVLHIVVEAADILAAPLQKGGTSPDGQPVEPIIPDDEPTNKAIMNAAISHAFELYGQEIPPEYAQQAGGEAPAPQGPGNFASQVASASAPPPQGAM